MLLSPQRDIVGVNSSFGNAQTVEEYVREYFVDTPILAEVAKCESRFRHVADSGNILRGEANRHDIGVMQINTYYHKDTAKRLDLDLLTLDGNLAYAQSLFDREGTVPWSASKRCWGTYEQHLAYAQ